MTPDAHTHLLALAASLESAGQYNNAKFLRAAIDSLLTRLAHAHHRGSHLFHSRRDRPV